MNRTIYAAIIFLTGCGQALCQRADSTAFRKIESIYRSYAAEKNIPGLAFGIVIDGKLAYSSGIGYSDLEKKIAVTPASVYRIASMTKSFTALAILKLRDEGKLGIDDPVEKFIPQIRNTRPLTADSPPITIRNLLTHTAGFPEDNPWGDRQLQRTDEELISFIEKGISLSSIPGAAYEYSNLGFAMLGYIVTRASGMHYEKYINENILAPLGMEHTYWEYSDVSEDLLVSGYRTVNGTWKKEEMLHSGAYGAMGGMLTSIQDFAKYMTLHISAWPAGNENKLVVKKSTLREMHLPGKIAYMYNLAKNARGMICPKIGSYNDGLAYAKDCNGVETVGHSGGLPGFGTHWTFLPHYGIGIVSFCNLTYAATSVLNARIIDTLINVYGFKPRQLKASAVLNDTKKRLAALLPEWKNAKKSGLFSENFFFDYFLDSLRRDARDLFAKAGRIVSLGEMVPDNQLRGYFVLYGRDTDIKVWFTLSPENPPLIQEYRMEELLRKDSAFAKYRLKTISDINSYKKIIADEPGQQLVRLSSLIPGISLDIRYATSNNIMHTRIYDKAEAYMLQAPVKALQAVQADLKPLGYALKIFDGYRPYNVTVKFYEKYLDSVFVASPYTGSRHNRGCAVDLTMIDLKTGKEVLMPTSYDSFTKEAAADYPAASAKAIRNRNILQKVMTAHGFKIYPSEWWHFDFEGWEKYPVMNLSFEMLETYETGQ